MASFVLAVFLDRRRFRPLRNVDILYADAFQIAFAGSRIDRLRGETFLNTKCVTEYPDEIWVIDARSVQSRLDEHFLGDFHVRKIPVEPVPGKG